VPCYDSPVLPSYDPQGFLACCPISANVSSASKNQQSSDKLLYAEFLTFLAFAKMACQRQE